MEGDSDVDQLSSDPHFQKKAIFQPGWKRKGKTVPSSRMVLSPKILMSTLSPSISTSLVKISLIALLLAFTSIEQIPSTTGFSPGARVGAFVLAGEGMDIFAAFGVFGGPGEGEGRRAGEVGREGERGGVMEGGGICWVGVREGEVAGGPC